MTPAAACSSPASINSVFTLYRLWIHGRPLFRFGPGLLVLLGLLLVGGLRGADTAPDTPRLGITMEPTPDGARVVQVMAGSAAERAGLQSGDLIIEINQRRMRTTDDVTKAVMLLKQGTPQAMVVERDGRRTEFSFVLSASTTAGKSRPAPPARASNAARSAAAQAPATADARAMAQTRGSDARKAQVADAAGRRRGGRGSARGTAATGPVRDTASQEALGNALRQTAYTVPESIGQRLTQFNVLGYAFVDPATGRVVLAGRYNPAYASGPIPYADLLADALQTPYPVFSLDHPGLNDPALRQIRSTFDQELTRVARDPAYGLEWMKSLILPVLTGSGDSEDRAALGARLQAAGSSLADYDAFMKWQAGQFTDQQYYPRAQNFLTSLFLAAGYDPSAGRAVSAYRLFASEPTREHVEFWCAATGCEEVLRRIDEEVRAGGNRHAAGRELEATLYSAMLARLGVPEAELRRIAAGYRNETVSEKAFVDLLDQRWGGALRDFLTNKVINGMTFSGAGLSGRYNFPPIRSALNTFGAPRDTMLMHVLFQADYTLKYLTSSARAAASIPGHATSQEFLATAEHRAGAAAGHTPTAGLIRYWIYPAAAGLDLLPDHGGVRFREASLRIGTESLESAGGDPRGNAFFRQALADYSTHLTQNFDAYARVYPSLHVLRETAKVIALARWARQSGIRLQPAGASPAHPTLPERAEGFWGMTYLVRPSGETDTMVVWAQGGVKFDQEYGDGWIQTRPAEREATDDTLKQLAASTALAEKAAAAATTDGDLETARDLAERSAQAMTGQIDLSKLPEPVAVMAGSNVSGPPDFAGQAEVAQAAAASVDQNVTAMKQARQSLADAAPLQQTNPPEYARIQEQAQQQQMRSEQNLQRLQSLLQQYRGGSAPAATVAVDLRQLDPTRPATVALLRPAGPGTEGVTAPPRPATPADVSALVQKTPTPEQLRAELARLTTQLETLKTSLGRLNRSIQMDQQQFQQWEDEAAGATARAQERYKQFITDQVEEAFFGWAEHYFRDVQPSAQRLEELARTKQVMDLNDFAEWADRKDEGLERIADGLRLMVDQLPLSEELKSAVWAVDTSIESAFDISAWLASWKRINQLDKNSDQFLRAVAQSGERMKQIVGRIKQIQQQLAAGAPPAAGRP